MSERLDLLKFTEGAVDKLRELEQELAKPDAPSSPDYSKLLREHGSLSKLVALREKVLQLRKQIGENEQLLQDEEEGIAELAQEELDPLRTELRQLTDELEEKMLLGGSDGDRNCIIELRAGAGGEEAALFTGDLFRMYQRYCERRGWKFEVLEVHEAGKEGIKEVVFTVSGEGTYMSLRYEGGGHRVQRVPVTESQGRIHTSAATVAVLPEVDEVEIEVNPNDLRIDTYAASGPGGQHVNRTMSAVRITHEPTGVVVSCQDERSQHKNKARAMKILRSKLYEAAQSEKEAERSAARKKMIGSGDRSDRIRTYNFPQNRLTDHRAGITLYSLDRIMEGELDELIKGLIAYDKKLRLEEVAADPSLLFEK